MEFIKVAVLGIIQGITEWLPISSTGHMILVNEIFPLKADADFFVLTREPVALCPFCSSDSDWPDNILVVYLSEKQRFVQNNAVIEVEGELEVGSWTDEHTGFVSQMRLRNATFHTL